MAIFARILKNEGCPDLLLHRGWDEEANPVVVIESILTDKADEEYSVTELVSFGSTETAIQFLVSFDEGAARRWLRDHTPDQA